MTSPRGPVTSARFVGIAASAGVAVGPALVLGPERVPFVQRQVSEAELEGERARFAAAVRTAQAELARLAQASRDGVAGAEGGVLEAYIAMVADPTLREAVERHMTLDHQCSEWAVATAVREFASELSRHEDGYLRERAHDFAFVGERLLLALTGAKRAIPKLEEPVILVARDLAPPDLFDVDRAMLVAIATEIGTRTSHTAIVARALEVPAVVGVAGLVEAVVSGDQLLVDGLRGTVTLHPPGELVTAGRARAERHRALARHLLGEAKRRGGLASGEAIELLANIEVTREVELATSHGAAGVGLYRTEFLFTNRARLPSEEEQFEAYREAARLLEGLPLTVRTFDLGADKQASGISNPKEQNPALGMRAIRLSLARPELLLTQFRAMIRASAAGPVRVMVPMVATVREWVEARRLFSRATEEVDQARHERADRVPLGMMVEVPSAAILADVFAPRADFLSLGTNDLVQYTLAADRTSPGLVHLSTPFDPAVLRLADRVAKAAESAGKPASVCGSMAGDPLGAILLVGLGFRCLSMEPAALPEVKEALSRITLVEARETARQALLAVTPEDVEHLLAATFAGRLFDLLSGDEARTAP